jgi:hypothetical protein
MAASTHLPDLRNEYPPHAPGESPAEQSTLIGLLPGIALLFVVGYAGKFVEHFLNTWTKAHHITFPNIEYVLWAILFGIVIANTIGVARIFRPGVATYDFWLKTGIILLGARFILGDVLKLGGISLILVFIAFAFSLTFMTWLGRTFKLSPQLTTSSPSAPLSAESPPSSPRKALSTPTKRTPPPPSPPSWPSERSRSSPFPPSATCFK